MATSADVTQPWLSGENRIDALLGQFFHWQYETPSDSAIYYTFSTTEGHEDVFFRPENISSFNAAQQNATHLALAEAAAITGIRFVEVADGNLADIHFAHGDLLSAGAAGQTSGASEGSSSEEMELLSYDVSAHVYLDNNEYAHLFADLAPGTTGYQILLHELGHALGLKHPHEGDIRLPSAEDNTGNTLMSYNWTGAPKSDFQAYDVAALEWWYGTDGLGGVSYGGTQTMLVNGTAGAETLRGGGGSDTIHGGAGNDTLIGAGGNDVMDGGPGADSMDGGLGGDMYHVSTGDIIVDAGGFDVVFSDISWTLAAGLEELRLLGSASLVGTGTSGDDVLRGNFGNHTLVGGAGNDELYARGSADRTFQGGSGNDFIVSTFDGNDRFVFAEAPGAANSDLIFHFGHGADKIVLDSAAHPNIGSPGQFAAGDARFLAAPGASAGQDPSDRVIYNTSTGELWYDADGSGAGAAQLITRMEPIPALAASDIIVLSAANPGVRITGTAGNDSLVGGNGDDTLDGLGGNDTLVGNGGADSMLGGAGNDLFAVGASGADIIDGGAGFDSIEFKDRATSAVVVDFVAGTITGGGSGGINFTNIERLVAGNFNDSLTGNAASQTLTGQAGSDTIWGAGGADTLWGGGGADTFVFRETGTANADRIADFTSGADKILLDGAVMTALGTAGAFSAGDARFKANSTGTATDASDRVIFNTTTKQVLYDADGSGSGAAVLIATLQSSATLAATDIVVEGDGPAPIVGTEGDDSLVGTEGNDTINGLGGNDTIDGAGGSDFLDGGAGNDSVRGGFNLEPGEGGADTLIGGAGNDTLDGGNSRFAGTDVNVDTLDGGLGDDRYIVDNEADVLSDAGGADTIVAVNVDWTLAAGFEHLNLFNEDEIRQTGIGNDLDNHMSGSFVVLEGRGGNDTLVGGGADGFGTTSVLSGGEGNDVITGRGEGDLLDGGSGNDTIDGGPAATTVNGGAGNDVLTGSDDADTFVFAVAPGAANADQITDFTSGLDTIRLDGNAHVNAGPSGRFAAGDARFAANSTGTAQDADDRVIYNTANGELWYDADGSAAGAAALIATLEGAPVLAASDIEVVNGTAPGNVINGTSGPDTLTGTAGDDIINGLGGNDLFLAGSTGGADTIDGGAGFDSIEFRDRATSAVVADFATGTISGGSSGTISFTNVERLVAGNFNDRLTGNAASQTLTGQAGSDTISGAGGADTLWGGGGADVFIFREMGTANADRISDFASGADKLHLDDAAFTAIGAMGNFAAGDGRFGANSTGTAQDANDRVVFNTSTGALYYDADGSGSGGSQLIATVQSGATVAATDIVVI